MQLARICLTWVLLTTVTLASESAFSIRVLDGKTGKSRPIAYPGAAFTVECHVPIQPGNRVIRIGVEGLGYSDMDAGAGTIYRREYKHADCSSGPAFCEVHRQNGTGARIQSPIMIVGCDDGGTK